MNKKASNEIRRSPFSYGANHILVLKIEDLIVQSDIYLNHAPAFEKYALCQTIRNHMDEIHSLAIDTYYTHFRKSTAKSLSMSHARLRAKWRLFWKKGYFAYGRGRRGVYDEGVAARRCAAVEEKTDEIGRIIGALCKNAADGEKAPQGAYDHAVNGESHNVPNCGGNWNNGTNAGVFARNLNNDRGNSNSNYASRLAACAHGLTDRNEGHNGA